MKDPSKKLKNTSRISYVIVVLCLLGLGIAVYMMISYSQDQAPYCAGAGGCKEVQTSAYVVIISGVLDVPTLGVIGFVLLLILNLIRGRVNQKIDRYLPLITYGVALSGFLYSGVYLTIIEAFFIHAWCYWCIATSALVTAVFILSVIELRRWYKSRLS